MTDVQILSLLNDPLIPHNLPSVGDQCQHCAASFSQIQYYGQNQQIEKAVSQPLNGP